MASNKRQLPGWVQEPKSRAPNRKPRFRQTAAYKSGYIKPKFRQKKAHDAVDLTGDMHMHQQQAPSYRNAEPAQKASNTALSAPQFYGQGSPQAQVSRQLPGWMSRAPNRKPRHRSLQRSQDTIEQNHENTFGREDASFTEQADTSVIDLSNNSLSRERLQSSQSYANDDLYSQQQARIREAIESQKNNWQHRQEVSSLSRNQRKTERVGGYGPRVIFSILSTTEVQMKIWRSVPQIENVVKLCEGSYFDRSLNAWRLPVSRYHALSSALGSLQFPPEITAIPQHVLAKVTLHCNTKNEGQNEQEEEHILKDLPAHLTQALAPFQKKGVCFVHRRGGRALIADEMGLGKTIQAIASAVLYKEEWPCLVLCPSGARFQWKQEFCTWLGEEYLESHNVDIAVVNNSKDELQAEAHIYIISYSLCDKIGPDLAGKNFQVIVADECHYLKNPDAKRTKTIVPLLAKAKRAILLSGTPALSRPIELFTQLQAIDPKSWNSLKEYGMRYCDGKRGRFGMDYSGSSNIEELHTILTSSVMIRRLKKDILTQLPPKIRQLVRIPIEDEETKKELRKNMEELSKQNAQCAKFAFEATRGSQQLDVASRGFDSKQTSSQSLDRTERQRLLMNMFQQTGRAKLPAIKSHLLRTLLDDVLCGKILVFGHHQEVLDSVEEEVLKLTNTDYIRIDGKTSPKLRQSSIQVFQTNPSCRVALLGINAAGVAITLTAASRVVFMELYWTPAVMLQAEDRCHRIGQTSAVTIQYLVAEGSLDDCLWPLIRKKMQLLGDMIEGDKTADMELQSEMKENKLGSNMAANSAIEFNGSDALEELVNEIAIEELKGHAAFNSVSDDNQSRNNAGAEKKHKPNESDEEVDAEFIKSLITPVNEDMEELQCADMGTAQHGNAVYSSDDEPVYQKRRTCVVLSDDDTSDEECGFSTGPNTHSSSNEPLGALKGLAGFENIDDLQYTQLKKEQFYNVDDSSEASNTEDFCDKVN